MHAPRRKISRIRHLGNAIGAALLITWEMQSRFHIGARTTNEGRAKPTTERCDAECPSRI